MRGFFDLPALVLVLVAAMSAYRPRGLARIHIGQFRVARLELVTPPAGDAHGLKMLSHNELTAPDFASRLFDRAHHVLVPHSLLPLLAQSLVAAPADRLLAGAPAPAGTSLVVTPPSGDAGTALLVAAQTAPTVALTDVASARARQREIRMDAPHLPGAADSGAEKPPPAPGSREARVLHAARLGQWATIAGVCASEPGTAQDAVDINATSAQHGATPLHYAALSGSLDTVCGLLDLGASVTAMASNGSTPLHWAAGAGHLEVMLLILFILLST